MKCLYEIGEILGMILIIILGWPVLLYWFITDRGKK